MARVIELTDLTFKWHPDQAPTLDIPSLTVDQGEHLFLKGPSGCGKSTLLGCSQVSTPQPLAMLSR